MSVGKNLVYLLMLIILTSSVLATDVRIESIKDVINLDGTASFNLSITASETSSFRLYYSGIEWDIPPQSFDLKELETKTILVTAKPIYVNSGRYAIPLTLKNEKGIITPLNLIVNVRSEKSASYLPSIGIGISFNETIIPNKEFDLKISLKNRNPLDLKNLEINIDSEYFSSTDFVNISPTTKLKTGEVFLEKTFFLGTIPAETIPIIVTIVKDGQTIASQQRSLNIKIYNPEFSTKKTVKSKVFKKTSIITITNYGNIEKKDIFKEKFPLFKGIFTSTSPESGVLKENGERNLVWELTLAPGESTQIIITTNYRPVVSIILVLLIGSLLYFTLRSSLVIDKKSHIIETAEGGISMLKVSLRIRNISNKHLENVKIFDRIPHLADHFKEDLVGSLLPDKIIKSEREGTLVSWNIGVLEPLEERIITYKIRTQLNILGGLSLTSAKAKFKKNGKNRVTSSSSFRIKQLE